MGKLGVASINGQQQQQERYKDENVSKKTPLTQRKDGWLGNKQSKMNKIRGDSDEESSESGLPSYHTSPSPTSYSESEGDIIEYEAASPNKPRTSEMRTSKSLDLNLNQINRALDSFEMFISEEYLQLKEKIGTLEASQASRITDSNKNINILLQSITNLNLRSVLIR